MSIRANSTFKFLLQGDGVNETIVRQPLSTNPDYTLVTGGAVSMYSPATRSKLLLQPGWSQLLDPAAYVQAPMARNYYALTWPAGSTTPWAIAGATTDAAVGMNPGMPMALGLAGAVPIYIYIPGATAVPAMAWSW